MCGRGGGGGERGEEGEGGGRKRTVVIYEDKYLITPHVTHTCARNGASKCFLKTHDDDGCSGKFRNLVIIVKNNVSNNDCEIWN